MKRCLECNELISTERLAKRAKYCKEKCRQAYKWKRRKAKLINL